MRRYSTVVLLCAVAVQAQPRASARLIYDRPPSVASCPDAAAVRGAVAGQLGYDPFNGQAGRLLFATIRLTTPGLTALVELRGPGGEVQGSRQLTTPTRDCRELSLSVVLAISLALDPYRAHLGVDRRNQLPEVVPLLPAPDRARPDVQVPQAVVSSPLPRAPTPAPPRTTLTRLPPPLPLGPPAGMLVSPPGPAPSGGMTSAPPSPPVTPRPEPPSGMTSAPPSPPVAPVATRPEPPGGMTSAPPSPPVAPRPELPSGMTSAPPSPPVAPIASRPEPPPGTPGALLGTPGPQVKPSRGISPLPEPSRVKLPLSPSTGVTAVAPRPEAPPTGRSRSLRPVAVAIDAGAIGSWGAAPALALGVLARLELRWHSLSLGVEGRYEPPVSAITLGNAGVKTSLILAEVVPCFRYRLAMACGIAAFGGLRGEGIEIAHSQTDATFYAALGGRLGLEIHLIRWFWLTAHADLLGPLVHTTLQIDGRTAWETPTVSGALGLQVKARFSL